MSEQSYLAGLEDGAASVRTPGACTALLATPLEDVFGGADLDDYDRGFVLGAGDVRARLAMYRTQRSTMTDAAPCPGAESLPAMLAELRR
jgi:hypothetical protein